jgi:hypothetical protein
MQHTARKEFFTRSGLPALGAALIAAAALYACSSGDGKSAQGGQGAGSSSGTGGSGMGGSGTGGDIFSSGPGGGGVPQGPFADFPEQPILDTPQGGAPPPANAPDLFGPAGKGDPGGPCLIEPSIGTLFPNNWLRPRFRFNPDAGQNLFEIRITAPNQTNPLVVYTTSTTWTMPKAMWDGLTAHSQDMPLTVTVRGATFDNGTLTAGPTVGSTGDIRIAPVSAAGTIVYWRTDQANNVGQLKGFKVGDESVVEVLRPDQVQYKPPNGQQTTCIGCHASTPDGKYAAFQSLQPYHGGVLGSVEPGSTGARPDYWTDASAQDTINGGFGIPSFSKAHWKAGDRIMLASMGTGTSAKLAWFDLEANASGEGQSFGYLQRDGDAHGAIMPSFSQDGTLVVYTSTDVSYDGRPDKGATDIYTVPYADRKGGAATPLPGASDPKYSEYYGAIAPNGALVAFDRVDAGTNTYNSAPAEVFVVPAKGGDPVRLAANDPPACSPDKSPGITNSWPKWAPEVTAVGDKVFYWLAFSSRRAGGVPQLYVTPVVVQGDQISTYPALYLWNQPANEANHTPAWDVFDIPQVPPK